MNEENKTKLGFMAKLVLFFAFSLGLPISYLTIRYKLFKVQKNLSIWAFIVIAIFIMVIIFMLKYYLAGMKTKYSFLKQIIEGLVKVVFPFLLALLLLLLVKKNLDSIVKNIDVVIETAYILLGSETIAVIINPLPKWAFENNVDGLAQIVNKVMSKGDKE